MTSLEERDAFSALIELYQGDIRRHAYGILRSHEDSEDATQEAFLRAWSKRRSFQGRSPFSTWLYRIATNTSYDALVRRQRRLRAAHSLEAGQLEEIPAVDCGPDDDVVARETVELALRVALQHLPARQRAVLIARDVLGWSAKETAALLETTVTSANSVLQRARETLRKQLPESRLDWAGAPASNEPDRDLLRRYLDVVERGDTYASAQLLRAEARG